MNWIHLVFYLTLKLIWNKMMKTKCLIVDDEPIAIQVINAHLDKIPNIEIVAKSRNALEAMEVLRLKAVDLIFLDIQMPQITGIDFIKTLSNPPKIIITTAYREFALDGFDLEVLDYLLKPISFERFLKALNRYYKSIPNDLNPVQNNSVNKEESAFINIKADRKVLKVRLADIFYIEGLKDYVKIHTLEKVIITKENIGHIDEKLSEAGFLRIHRSFIVSIEKIKAFTAEIIEINNKELPIGLVYKNIVLNKLNYRSGID